MTAAPTPGAADVERLRHLCHAVLRAIDAPGTGAAALAGALLRAIGGGVTEVAAGVRREADALAAAAAGVRDLPTRYLALPPSVADLLCELDAARVRAAGLADALDAVRVEPQSPSATPPPLRLDAGEPPPPPQPAAASASPDAPPRAPAVERAAPRPGGAASESRSSPEGHSAPDATPPETEAAARAYAAAERCRKLREFEQAERWYTDAIGLDPRFGPAYARRGQCRLARRAYPEAVADFDAALALDAAAVEAWSWRGDARALEGRLDDAIADYTRALELCPDYERVRFNLAVARRRKTDAAAPRTPVAPTDLPPCPAPDSSPAIEPAPEPTAVRPPKPRPAPPVALTPEKKGGGQLVVNCPHCGAGGEVSWDRLGKVLVCRACDRRFGVSGDGRAVELVEAPGGKWIEAGRVREDSRRRRKRRVALLAVVAAAVLFPALGFAGWRAVRPEPVEVREIELPSELGARAELFATAWLTNDVRLMRRLTTPTHDKAVYSWYVRHRPPAALRGTADGAPPAGTRFEAALLPGTSGHTTARVRVSNPTAASPHPPVELVLAWEERGDGWYFVPPTK